MARAVLMMLFCNVIGGLTYPWQKMALEGLPPATITALRSLLAIGCMAGWIVAKEGRLRWPWDRRATGRLAVVGTAGLAFPLMLGIWGLERSTAANASILILLEPVSILVFSHLLLRERVGGTRGAGVAIGIAGALCVVAEDLGSASLLGSGHFAGNLMLAASAVLWGVYSPVISPLAKKHSAVELAFATQVVAQVMFTPAAILESNRWVAGPHLGEALLYTAILGLLASFLGTVLWVRALRDLPASVVAPFVLLQPAIGAGAGVLLLDERLSNWALAGAALAACGVGLVLYGERRAAVPAE